MTVCGYVGESPYYWRCILKIRVKYYDICNLRYNDSGNKPIYLYIVDKANMTKMLIVECRYIGVYFNILSNFLCVYNNKGFGGKSQPSSNFYY